MSDVGQAQVAIKYFDFLFEEPLWLFSAERQGWLARCAAAMVCN
jgi:hypothetical protein